MKYGKIVSMTGNTGKIIDTDGNKYIFINNEKKDNELKVNDYVSFNPEIYETIEIKQKVARFVKKMK